MRNSTESCGGRDAFHEMAGIASFNLVVAACLTLLFVFINPSWTWRDVSHQAVGSFVYTNTIGIPSAIIFSRMGAWILGRRVAVRWTLMIGVFLAIAAAGTLAASVILYAIYSPTWSDFWVQYLQGFRIAALITLIVGIGSVYYEMQKRRLEATTLELRTRELERERMLKQATEARLAALESRIHPHFLFNALNSISSLIPDDPQRAERLIERMAALLRFSLDSGRRGLAPLAQEMKIVADYLEIEKTRFGPRLRYSIDLPADAETCQVPPLAIQTLVENSVKYAVAPRREGGSIQVSAKVSDSRLMVLVSDDGPGFSEDAIPAGHGLDNLRSRLATLFGEDASLSISNGDGTMVALTLPTGGESAQRVSAG